MNIKIKKSALQNVLLNLLNEADAPPPAQSTAPAPEAPELDNAGLIAKKAAELSAGPSGSIVSGNRTFVKQDNKFFIKDIQVSTEELLALVNDETRVRLEKEIKQGAKSIGVRGDEFIQAVSRGASFESQSKGTWRDLAEIPVDTVAEFILRNDGEMSSNAPYVTGEVTATAGKHLVYRTTELMIVIPEDAKDVYIMSTQNDLNDPLGSAAQLLKSVGIIDEWSPNPIRFYELVGTGPEAGKDFALQIDEKLDLGNFNKALKGIRTGAGKFFDFLNPFEKANIEVNFKFTKFGPALVRANVFGGKGGRVQAGGLTDKDLQRLADTDYFRYETLGSPAVAEYKFKTARGAPPDPRDAKPKSDKQTYNAEQVKITIAADGAADAPDGAPNSMVRDYGFGRALWIYLKGFLEGKSAAPVEAAPTPPTESAAPVTAGGQTVDAFIAKNAGKEVCPGAAYFAHNSAVLDAAGTAYVTNLNAAIATAARGLSDSKETKLAITLVGTADPSGVKEYNTQLAEKRVDAVDTVVRDVDSLKQFFGEDPWPDDWAKYAHPASESASLRFVKAYWGFPNPDALKASISDFAKNNSISGTITEVKNQVTEAQLRAYIRRMLLNE